MKSRLIIAAAGSGKTRFLIKEAFNTDKTILITTFTEDNEREVKKRFIEEKGYIPSNVTVQTWFSFLLQHGVKPYQSSIIDDEIKGLILVNERSGVKYNNGKNKYYYGENDPKHYYFNSLMQIYSDKISKFVFSVNEKTNGDVIDRIKRIYNNIYIDEVQDLAGYDLEIIKLLLKENVNMLLVGDPRQVTYHTHEEAKNKKYAEGAIERFIIEQCKSCNISVDKETLNISYRNQKKICALANSIFPEEIPCGYIEHEITGHDGVFFVNSKDVDYYLSRYKPVQLRDSAKRKVNNNYPVSNFGKSKGLTFQRVLIYPTKPMIEWIVNNKELVASSKSKLYVAITRAVHSVAFVYDDSEGKTIRNIKTYIRD